MTKSRFISLSGKQRRLFFSSELKKSLDRNGMTAAQLASELSLSYHRVRHWVNGRSIPSYQTIALIANHLGDDELSRAGMSASHRVCANCGQEYTAQSTQGRSYLCSPRCKQENERVRSKSGRSSVVRAEYEAPKEYRLAVEKFCKECEPGGMCHNGSCALRPISPLPLFSKSQAVFSSGGTQRLRTAKSK